jgi:NAD(P)-dependent dehydrogenase (short-subunit alcohol dehydrogenase family)
MGMADHNVTQDFRDKVVIVTGSSRGIGKTTALGFLRSGAKVVLNGRNAESLQRTKDEFARMGFPVFAFQGDLKDPATCHELMKHTLDQFGKIDILVNNAGGGFRGEIENTSPDVFREVINANLMSAIFCTLAALTEIKKTRGSIVFISSLAGIRGLPQNAPYSVAKMGLTALAQALRTELHGSGVHIGIIMVGFTDFDEDKRVTDASGALIPISRKSHQTREQVSRIVLRTVKKRKFLVVLTTLGRITMLMQRFCPVIVEWIVLRNRKSETYNQ